MNLMDTMARIEELLDIDSKTVDLEISEKSTRIRFLTGQNIDGIEEKYSIYDCSENDELFDLDEYREMMENEEGLSTQIIIFKDWDNERKAFWESYDKCRNAKEKNLLNQYFTKKISVYTNLEEKISLQVEEDGINYLEYVPKEDKELKGYIYNVSICELKKLFNVTGTSLFKMNVRNGLKKNVTGKELRRKFRDYLCSGFYTHIIQIEGMKNQKSKIEEALEITDIGSVANSVPKYFWFYHNGITIFSYDVSIDRMGSLIKLNPSKVSVINGAQTLTHFFSEWDELKHNLPKNMRDIQGISESKIIEILDEVCRQITIKTICIEGKLDNVRPITNGLNTQIPIFKEDIIADQDLVREINKIIVNGGIKILKSGEDDYNGDGLSVIDFVKKYLLIENKPGRSKNLRKAEIETVLSRAEEKLKSGNAYAKSIIKDFKVIKELEAWWKETKDIRAVTYSNSKDEIINNYGKNYFISYFLNETDEWVAPEVAFVLYNNFLQVLKDVDENITLEAFKKDELFEKYLSYKAQWQASDLFNDTSKLQLNEDEKDLLKEYLISKEVCPYTYAKVISEYLRMLGKDIPYFRVIKRYREKGEEQFYPQEAFPFPNSTFSELYRNTDEGQETEGIYQDYSKSLFGGEIHKFYPVFVLDFKKNQKGINKIESIKVIKKFSFESVTDKAKEVYEKTIEAFQVGDEKRFPKTSDNLGFHIRPKAMNGDDTFEFTNGMQITKRTFWANRETINELIEKLKED